MHEKFNYKTKSRGDRAVVNVGEGEKSLCNAIEYNTNTDYTAASKYPALNPHLYDSTHNEHYQHYKSKTSLRAVVLDNITMD